MEREHKNRIFFEFASLALKSCSFPSISWSISPFQLGNKNVPLIHVWKKDLKQTRQNVKPYTPVGPYVVTYSLFAICLFNMAKLADCYSVYEIQMQPNSAGPVIPGWGCCRRPTVWIDALPGRSAFCSSGQPPLLPCLFRHSSWTVEKTVSSCLKDCNWPDYSPISLLRSVLIISRRSLLMVGHGWQLHSASSPHRSVWESATKHGEGSLSTFYSFQSSGSYDLQS